MIISVIYTHMYVFVQHTCQLHLHNNIPTNGGPLYCFQWQYSVLLVFVMKP